MAAAQKPPVPQLDNGSISPSPSLPPRPSTGLPLRKRDFGDVEENFEDTTPDTKRRRVRSPAPSPELDSTVQGDDATTKPPSNSTTEFQAEENGNTDLTPIVPPLNPLIRPESVLWKTTS
ncbi:hypothetical protein G7Y89_g15221 [Cudoniella acicularis]|uniref:Uncharacterized protein n=1 Tax=Cudoniella acicularis TaxID=354080 RepID=A0A8H4QS29_9HELO|nr:hypothetical protein G7Y89_g15221 [Cudoniella acicularis]